MPGHDLIAEAVERRMAQLAREEAEQNAAAAVSAAAAAAGPDPDGVALDALDLIEALARRHEETTAAVLRWSWKLFCARWGRLYTWSAAERERQEAREVERQFARLHAGG